MNIKWKIAVCSSFVLSLVGIGTLSAKMHSQEVAFERLRQDHDRLEKLKVENQHLEGVVIDSAEMERLRRETLVLLKLRNEYSQLTQSNGNSFALHASTEQNVQKLLEEREELIGEEQQIHQLSNRATCIKNLEQIASAKVRWAEVNAAEKGLPVVIESLIDYFPEHIVPVCPAGGHYSVNRIGATPGCSVGGHSIP
jgi:hypothetical protein